MLNLPYDWDMRISDYKGDKTKTFKKVVAWLNKHQRKIRSLAGIGLFSEKFGSSSWGVPSFSKLNEEQTQWISSQTEGWLSNPCTALDEYDIVVPSNPLVVV
jgi:hypothetical protein